MLSLRGAAGIPSATFLKAFERQVTALRSRGIPIVLAGVSPVTWKLLVRTGRMDALGEDNVIAERSVLMDSLGRAYQRAEQLRVSDEPREEN